MFGEVRTLMSRLVLGLFLIGALPGAGRTQADVEAAVKKLGGRANVEKALADDANIGVSFEAITDKHLVAIAKLPTIGGITATSAAKVTNVGLEALAGLPHLQKLVLPKLIGTSQTPAAIAALKKLEILSFAESKVGDGTAAALKKHATLRKVNFQDTALTDQGLASLATLPHLEELNLSGTKVTDKGLLALKGCESLTRVMVIRTKVTLDGARALDGTNNKLTVQR
jgi:hypothetical protein